MHLLCKLQQESISEYYISTNFIFSFVWVIKKKKVFQGMKQLHVAMKKTNFFFHFNPFIKQNEVTTCKLMTIKCMSVTHQTEMETSFRLLLWDQSKTFGFWLVHFYQKSLLANQKSKICLRLVTEINFLWGNNRMQEQHTYTLLLIWQ